MIGLICDHFLSQNIHILGSSSANTPLTQIGTLDSVCDTVCNHCPRNPVRRRSLARCTTASLFDQLFLCYFVMTD